MLTGLRILLAEDSEDVQGLLRYYLHAAEAHVECANNGIEAVAQIARATVPFDFVFMDMQMPLLDGYAATKQLRAAGYRGVIVALTAHAMVGERERCIEAGCTDYLAKPPSRDEVVAKVLAHATARPGASPGVGSR